MRCALWRLRGVKIHSQCRIASGVHFERGVHQSRSGEISLAEGVELSQGVVLHSWGGSILLHPKVFIGPYSVVYGHGGVEIGADTLIAEHCSIHSANHTIPPRDRHIRWEPDIRKKTVIGKDVWIGAGARILAGVHIGDGCVIGAGAVVTENIEPYSIAVGVPARVVNQRKFSESENSSGAPQL